MELQQLPSCMQCNEKNPNAVGKLVPLSDYGQDGASVPYKAWACTNPNCNFALRIDKGEISRGHKLNKTH